MCADWTDDRLARVAIEAADVAIRKHYPDTPLNADDVIGRVYIRLTEIRAKLANHHNPIGYARTCAYFEAMKELQELRQTSTSDRRRHEREKHYCASKGIEDAEPCDTGDQQTIDDQDELCLLFAAVSQDQQDVLVGVHIFGWSYQEMNEHMHRHPSWASSTMFQALKRARGALTNSQMWRWYRTIAPPMSENWTGTKGPSRPHGSTASTTRHIAGFDEALSRAMQKCKMRRSR